MTAPDQPAVSFSSARREDIFPALTAGQMQRVAARGQRRSVSPGEVLFAAGETDPPFFVIERGQVEIVESRHPTRLVVTRHGPGEFTGEASMLSGRRSLVSARVTEAGEVIELTGEELLALVHGDGELSEIIMRAFIHRRLQLIAHGIGDVVVVGSQHSADTLRIKEFLSRNRHPYAYLDLDTDVGVQALLDGFGVSADAIPVVICSGTNLLRNPTSVEIADMLGFNAAINPTELRDVIVVGAGPAGLAAAVYAASEGLDVLVIEANAPGGQAGTSSKIENYLGFPTGISGQDLAARAYDQSQKFGAQVMIAHGAVRLHCHTRPYRIEVSDGTVVEGRTVVIATGAEYRRLPLENLERLEGAGVYHSATFMEAQLVRGEEVVIVGGGNSAGQAAIYLTGFASHVHIVIRASGLEASMSRYLIRRIDEHPTITLHVETELASLEGVEHVESIGWRDRATGAVTEHAIRHLFVMIGAVPATEWLHDCLALDTHQFIKTGPHLLPEELAAARWSPGRQPFLLETSRPGVFAVGDVRSGNVKRVASAVGEGSIAISFVHQALGD